MQKRLGTSDPKEGNTSDDEHEIDKPAPRRQTKI